MWTRMCVDICVCMCVDVVISSYFSAFSYVTKVNIQKQASPLSYSTIRVRKTCWHPCVTLMRVSPLSIIQHTCFFFRFLHYSSKIFLVWKTVWWPPHHVSKHLEMKGSPQRCLNLIHTRKSLLYSIYWEY